MRIQNIKDWLKAQRQANEPQFEIVHYDPSGSMTVKRLMDDKLIERFQRYYIYIQGEQGGMLIVDIQSFRKDLIHVDLRIYELKSSGEFAYKKSRKVEIDNIFFP